ncbi:hypothetical protein Tco_1206627 [Tanacetum coccineum]
MSSQYPSLYLATPHIMNPMAHQGFVMWSFTYHATIDPRPQYAPSHNRDDVMNWERRETRPNIFLQSPFMPLPDTDVAPKKWVDKSRNKTRNAKVSPFDLGKRVVHGNARDDEVMVTWARAIEDYISFENVDHTKVLLEDYVNCMTFLYKPEHVFLDFHIKGFRVMEQFLREQVPLMYKGGNYKVHDPDKAGWLSYDLMIRTRPHGARITVAKSMTPSLHLGSKTFAVETYQNIRGTLDGSTRPYPSWDDVDWVYMPINVRGFMNVGVRILPNVDMIS